MLYKECIEDNYLNKRDKVALIYEDKIYTFLDIKNKIEEYEEIYKSAGVRKKDKVLIVGKNSDVFVFQIFLCIKMELVFIPISEKNTPLRYEYILKDSKADFVFDIANNTIKRNPFYDEKHEDIFSSEKIQCMIYSSGTTSFPKGIIEPEKSMVYAVHKINERIKNTENDNILVGLPLSFDYGLYQLFLGFSVGACIVLLESFDFVQKIPGMINKYNITGLPIVPAIFELYLRCGRLNVELNSLRYISSTGDVLNVDSICKFKNVYPNVRVIPMYGITECKRVFIMDDNWEKIMKGSCGIPLNGIEVKIVDENGNSLGAMKKGELVVTGENVMAGYFGDDEATNKTFLLNENKRTLFTGDLFYFDQDGYYYFCGRMNHYIKRRGIKVSPEEVEMYLKKIKEIDQCLVLGIPHSIEGETVWYIIKKKDYIDEKKIIIKLNEILNIMPLEWRASNIVFTDNAFPISLVLCQDLEQIKMGDFSY